MMPAAVEEYLSLMLQAACKELSQFEKIFGIAVRKQKTFALKIIECAFIKLRIYEADSFSDSVKVIQTFAVANFICHRS